MSPRNKLVPSIDRQASDLTTSCKGTRNSAACDLRWSIDQHKWSSPMSDFCFETLCILKSPSVEYKWGDLASLSTSDGVFFFFLSLSQTLSAIRAPKATSNPGLPPNKQFLFCSLQNKCVQHGMHRGDAEQFQRGHYAEDSSWRPTYVQGFVHTRGSWAVIGVRCLKMCADKRVGHTLVFFRCASALPTWTCGGSFGGRRRPYTLWLARTTTQTLMARSGRC